MSTEIVAIPSVNPGGMDAEMSMHFGHCDMYTLVTIKDGTIESVATLPNVPHNQGSCMMSVQHLTAHGVTSLLAGGMGMRPLMGFKQQGIEVFFAGGYSTVQLAVQALLDGKLPAFSTDFTCQGHHHA